MPQLLSSQKAFVLYIFIFITFQVTGQNIHKTKPTHEYLIDNNVLLSTNDSLLGISKNTSAELPEYPDDEKVQFTRVSGFYEQAFHTKMSSNTHMTSIVYTLDGSNPQNSSTAVTVANPTTIFVDPTSIDNRGTTPAVVVRASITKSGYTPSKPISRTFIFLDKVKEQSYPGYSWPSYNINDQFMDYDVVNNKDYEDQIDEAFKSIPTISVLTDNANLFDENTGIYVNALNDGREWERECSIELIDTADGWGFNVNAGIRIRGGYSRHSWYPKHAFRLFFRSEYGASKLYYPLFGNEGVGRYDKVDLRCAQNYSWAGDGGEHNTFVREVFARDAQAESGNPYTRSRYYHLYLNGMYWGLYQTQERSDANWAEDYLGGDEEEYDVIKTSGVGEYFIEATDGNLNKWEIVYNISEKGFSNNKNYFLLEGKNENGTPMKQSEVLVNVDNLIDYMINIFYTGNFDAPVSKFGRNKFPNNMYAVNNREEKSSGFVFLIHDAEHTMMIDPTGPGIGLEENRVNIGNIGGDYQMEIDGFSEFNPQWLHYKLTDNIEYKQRFGDLAWKRLYADGIFTEDANIERLDRRAEQIDMAIIAESARWGDTYGQLYTKDNAWLPELNKLRFDYFSERTQIVIEQLIDEGLFSGVPIPVVAIDGKNTLESQVFINSTTTVSLSNTSGDIYYTTDGYDPRMVNGAIIPHALRMPSGTSLEFNKSMILKARVNRNGAWSALREIHFVAEQTDYSHFKVTELHYNPADSIVGVDTTDGDNYEFIEFRNTSTEHAINLTGLVIDSAIYYEFPENELLAPGHYYVIAAKPKKFYARYGWHATGNYSSSLSNGGEQVLITNSEGDVVLNFTYKDEAPWAIAADGTGASLTAKETKPTGDPNDWSYWMGSSVLHGTPFGTDAMATAIDDKLYDGNLSTNALKVYPNPTNDFVEVSYSNQQNNEFTLRIIDLKGVTVFTSQFNENASVSMHNLGVKYGVYILSIEKQDGIETRKIVYSPL